MSGDKSRVAAFGESLLPWERGEKSRQHFRLYYQVVLGSVRMEPAISRLIERYGDDRKERPGARGQAALAVVTVNRSGCPVESPTVAVSSFGWGVMSALNGRLEDLARWEDIEPKLTERIERRFLGLAEEEQINEDLERPPLTRDALREAYDDLVAALGLPPEWVEPPQFAIRSYVYFKDPNPPEPLLLNSFFLADLALARKLFSESAAPQNLRRYLGVDQPNSRSD